jgi:hypothetical protein
MDRGLRVEGQSDKVDAILDQVGKPGGKTHLVLVKWEVRKGKGGKGVQGPMAQNSGAAQRREKAQQNSGQVCTVVPRTGDITTAHVENHIPVPYQHDGGPHCPTCPNHAGHAHQNPQACHKNTTQVGEHCI